jgi:hypothetical protein
MYQHAIRASTPAAQSMVVIDNSFREEVGLMRHTISVTSRHKTENTRTPKKNQPICPADQKNDVMTVHLP